MSFRLFLYFRIYKFIEIICHMDYINKHGDILAISTIVN